MICHARGFAHLETCGNDLHFSQGVSISHEDNEDCDSSHLTMHGDCPCGIPWNPSPDFHWISRLASRPCMELVQPLASGWSHLVIQALSKHAWNEMAYSGRLKFRFGNCKTENWSVSKTPRGWSPHAFISPNFPAKQLLRLSAMNPRKALLGPQPLITNVGLSHEFGVP